MIWISHGFQQPCWHHSLTPLSLQNPTCNSMGVQKQKKPDVSAREAFKMYMSRSLQYLSLPFKSRPEIFFWYYHLIRPSFEIFVEEVHWRSSFKIFIGDTNYCIYSLENFIWNLHLTSSLEPFIWDLYWIFSFTIIIWAHWLRSLFEIFIYYLFWICTSLIIETFICNLYLRSLFENFIWNFHLRSSFEIIIWDFYWRFSFDSVIWFPHLKSSIDIFIWDIYPGSLCKVSF